MKNTFLMNEADSIINKNTPAMFKIEFYLKSEVSVDFSFTPIILDSVSIQQNFLTDIGDTILIHFLCGYKDYTEIYANRNNLTGFLKFDFKDNEGRPLDNSKIISKTYRALLVNQIDISKKVVDTNIRNEFDIEVEIRLIEDNLYKLRQTKINAIYTGIDIKSLIEHVNVSFGIDDFYLVEPDNIFVYSQLCIPPVKSYMDIYSWIHSTYGVYMQGIVHYYYNGRLYIYPPFDTNPQFPYTMVVIQTEQGKYAGAPSYHTIEGTTLYVVTNTIKNVVDQSMMNGENLGTDVSFYRSSELIDGSIQIGNDKSSINFKNSNGVTLGMKNSNLAKSNSKNTIYMNSTDNIFPIASTIAAKQGTLVEFEWTHAVPYVLFPGMRVIYYSDENGSVATRTGILQSAEYKFIHTNQTSGGKFYIGGANIVVNLESHSQNKSSSTMTSSEYSDTDGTKSTSLQNTSLLALL